MNRYIHTRTDCPQQTPSLSSLLVSRNLLQSNHRSPQKSREDSFALFLLRDEDYLRFQGLSATMWRRSRRQRRPNKRKRGAERNAKLQDAHLLRIRRKAKETRPPFLSFLLLFLFCFLEKLSEISTARTQRPVCLCLAICVCPRLLIMTGWTRELSSLPSFCFFNTKHFLKLYLPFR